MVTFFFAIPTKSAIIAPIIYIIYIGIPQHSRNIQLFLQKMPELFHISQNYSIFALDFATKPIGERSGVAKNQVL